MSKPTQVLKKQYFVGLAYIIKASKHIMPIISRIILTMHPKPFSMPSNKMSKIQPMTAPAQPNKPSITKTAISPRIIKQSSNMVSYSFFVVNLAEVTSKS